MKTNTSPAPAELIYDLENPVAVDGDTIIATLDLGFDVLTRQRFRLKGFYAPELAGARPEEGEAAKRLLQAAVSAARCQCRRRGLRKDNHGRWIVTLLINGVPADPFIIIFPYQLSEQDHKKDVQAQRLNKTGGARVL